MCSSDLGLPPLGDFDPGRDALTRALPDVGRGMDTKEAVVSYVTPDVAQQGPLFAISMFGPTLNAVRIPDELLGENAESAAYATLYTDEGVQVVGLLKTAR